MVFRRLVLLVAFVAGCDLVVPPNVDRDNDLRRDVEDNCASVANPDQSDFDLDGVGDACDSCDDGGAADEDADGIPDGCDGCIDNGEDIDGDNIPDNCDLCLGVGDDVDGDGIDDACDACVGTGADVDQDGLDDGCDDCVGTGADLDADGIDDGCDSCVATGGDTDLDGLDDACDPCNLGPQHDEDADGVFDDCDVCASRPDPAQANSLESFFIDETGDVCDQDFGINHELFDSFAYANAGWYVQGAGWSNANDAMNFADLTGGYAYRLIVGDVGGSVDITSRAHISGVSASTPPGLMLFVADEYAQPAPSRFECEIASSGNLSGPNLRLNVTEKGVTTTSSVVAIPNPTTIELQMLVVDDPGGVKPTITCLANGASVSATYEVTGVVWHAGMAARGKVFIGFDYFDVITR